jgi:hypothetical protein
MSLPCPRYRCGILGEGGFRVPIIVFGMAGRSLAVDPRIERFSIKYLSPLHIRCRRRVGCAALAVHSGSGVGHDNVFAAVDLGHEHPFLEVGYEEHGGYEEVVDEGDVDAMVG